MKIDKVSTSNNAAPSFKSKVAYVTYLYGRAMEVRDFYNHRSFKIALNKLKKNGNNDIVTFYPSDSGKLMSMYVTTPTPNGVIEVKGAVNEPKEVLKEYERLHAQDGPVIEKSIIGFFVRGWSDIWKTVVK